MRRGVCGRARFIIDILELVEDGENFTRAHRSRPAGGGRANVSRSRTLINIHRIAVALGIVQRGLVSKDAALLFRSPRG
jgi:hypothetical protein